MHIPPELILLLRRATSVVALTGAGVSQESGLRTFRDAQSGLWTQHRPEDLASPEAFQRNPRLVWDWYAMRREQLAEVQPNPGHFALAEMATHIPDFVLVTQNVDGLHRKAGSPRVIELHGNLGRVKCSDCGLQVDSWNDDDEDLPHCRFCGGLLRPDVIWFGERLPQAALQEAVRAARRCDVFFSIGTSGLVQPAASLAHAARNKGAVVVEINLDPTPLSAKADFVLRARSGEILPELVRETWIRS
jgi:NAD-dependent deacetylase